MPYSEWSISDVMTLNTSQVTDCDDLEIEGLAVDYARDIGSDPHSHDNHQIIHAASGIMRIHTPAGSWVVGPGRVVYVPGRVVHDTLFLTTVLMRTIYISGEHSLLPSNCCVWQISPLMREILVRLSHNPPLTQRRLLIPVLLTEISIIDLVPLSLPTLKDPRLTRIQQGIESNPEDTQSLKQWADTIGASPRTLMRLVERETGFTFRQWRRQIKIMQSLERLAKGATISATAYELGYSTPSAFIQAFREVLGTSPARYFKRQVPNGN